MSTHTEEGLKEIDVTVSLKYSKLTNVLGHTRFSTSIFWYDRDQWGPKVQDWVTLIKVVGRRFLR